MIGNGNTQKITRTKPRQSFQQREATSKQGNRPVRNNSKRNWSEERIGEES